MIKNNEPFDIFIVSNLKGITLVRRSEDRLRRVTLVSASFERRILSCIHDKAFIPTNEIITKYNIFKKIKEKKAWSKESKLFSISVVSTNLSVLEMSMISLISAIDLLLWLVNLLLTCVIYYSKIIFGKTFLTLAARVFKKNW